MGLLNYTTTISPAKTAGEIQEILIRAGAKSILMEFDDNRMPIAVSFLILTQFGERGFRLPANMEAIYQTLVRQYQAGEIQRRFVNREQAARVGWRIVKDWLEAQLAIIETEMVTFDQVMLPYMTNNAGQTTYDILVSAQLALPEPRA